MTTIAKHKQFEKLLADQKHLQEELAALYFEKDELTFHVCKNIEMEYMLKIGALEYKLFEKECQLLRIKRKIELIVQKINREETFIIEAIEAQLDTEYAEYTQKLNAQFETFQNALKRKEAGLMDDDKAKEMKRLYNELVKKLHPDLLPKPDKKKNELFIRAVEAYKSSDLEALQAISMMIDEPIPDNEKESSITGLQKKIASLQEHIANVKTIIEKIKDSFPYNQADLLKSPAEIEQRKKEMNKKLDEYNAAYAEYETKLQSLTGG